MILLGGLQSLHGPILGALAFTGLGELPQLVGDAKPFARFFATIGLDDFGLRVQALAERKLLLEGLVILAVVLALPRGLASLRWPRFIRPAYGRSADRKAQVRS